MLVQLSHSMSGPWGIKERNPQCVGVSWTKAKHISLVLMVVPFASLRSTGSSWLIEPLLSTNGLSSWQNADTLPNSNWKLWRDLDSCFYWACCLCIKCFDMDCWIFWVYVYAFHCSSQSLSSLQHRLMYLYWIYSFIPWRLTVPVLVKHSVAE